MLGGCTGSANKPAERATAISEVQAAYDRLLAQQPVAVALATDAKGVLVLPNVLKAGFVLGGYHGSGALRKGDEFTHATSMSP
ncbi:MAG: hypothetical protein IT432_16560 [Phycisphaerales bacterium]|nr:hypothetical protein [Phycisphaerales bacterium]